VWAAQAYAPLLDSLATLLQERGRLLNERSFAHTRADVAACRLRIEQATLRLRGQVNVFLGGVALVPGPAQGALVGEVCALIARALDDIDQREARARIDASKLLLHTRRLAAGGSYADALCISARAQLCADHGDSLTATRAAFTRLRAQPLDLEWVFSQDTA
jgi:hypothetical protein